MNVITERRLLPSPPEVTESSDEVEFAGQRWRWTLRVTQTQVDSLRRMDVSVAPADAAEDAALVTVTGFYGTAIGASGGGTVVWTGTGDTGRGDDNADDGSQSDPTTPGEPDPDPPADDPQE